MTIQDDPLFLLKAAQRASDRAAAQWYEQNKDDPDVQRTMKGD